MVRTIIKTRICCVRVWFMGRHIYSYSLGNFPRINISYLVSNMITGSVNTLPLNMDGYKLQLHHPSLEHIIIYGYKLQPSLDRTWTFTNLKLQLHQTYIQLTKMLPVSNLARCFLKTL